MVGREAYEARYMWAARGAGCPQEQVDNFMAAGYVAQPKQLQFHAACRAADQPGGPVMIGLGGSRGPGKSHSVMAQIGLDDCQRMPGLKVLFLRNIKRAASESFEDLVIRVLPAGYKLVQGKLEFPNGSRVLVGGYKDESDIDGFLGIEYDLIALEEATLLTEAKVDMLRGSLRTSKTGWRTRMYLTTNPDGVGHAWFKRRLVEPQREGKETATRFIPSTYRDNHFLDAEYITYLEGLTGTLARAWRDGDWDIFEGQCFPSWNYDRHVIPPMEIPEHWTRLRGIDWGYSNPFCCLWAARNPDNGRVIVYREAYERTLTDRQQAELIQTLTPANERISITFADPSMWSRKTQEVVTSTAEVYNNHGVALTSGDNDRLSGKRKVDRLLGNLPDGEPSLQIFSTCTNLIRTLPELVYDKVRVEDVDSNQEDHAYDALRYLLSSVKDQSAPPAKQQINPWLKRKGL